MHASHDVDNNLALVIVDICYRFNVIEERILMTGCPALTDLNYQQNTGMEKRRLP